MLWMISPLLRNNHPRYTVHGVVADTKSYLSDYVWDGELVLNEVLTERRWMHLHSLEKPSGGDCGLTHYRMRYMRY